MRQHATIASFRKFNALEETMMRAMMPRTSAADPTPLPAFAQDEQPSRVRWRLGRRYETKVVWQFGEVAHA